LPMVAALMYSMAQDNIKVKPLKSNLQLLWIIWVSLLSFSLVHSWLILEYSSMFPFFLASKQQPLKERRWRDKMISAAGGQGQWQSC
jgi:hypothetical protein